MSEDAPYEFVSPPWVESVTVPEALDLLGDRINDLTENNRRLTVQVDDVLQRISGMLEILEPFAKDFAVNPRKILFDLVMGKK
jgi:hypothetical protein